MSFHAYQSCRGCTGGPRPGTVYVMQALIIKHPYVRSLGVYSCRDVAGTSTFSIHACGRAGDPGIPTQPGGAANPSLGNPPLQDLIEHADELGIMGIIYARVRYDARSPRGRYYGGRHPHNDHIHYEQTDHHARTLTRARVFEILGVQTGGDDQMLNRNSPSPSSAVAMFQRDLITLGYDLGDWPSIQPSLYPPGADGGFGNDVEAATKKFQSDLDLAVTGQGDALTVALAANLARFSEHPRGTGGRIEVATSGGGVTSAQLTSAISAHAKAKASATLHPHSHDEGVTGAPR